MLRMDGDVMWTLRLKKEEAGNLALGTWMLGLLPSPEGLLGKGYMKDCGTSHSCGGPWGSLARGNPTNPMDIWASQGIIQRVGRDRALASEEPGAFVYGAAPASQTIGANPPGAPHLPPRSSSLSSLLGQEREWNQLPCGTRACLLCRPSCLPDPLRAPIWPTYKSVCMCTVQSLLPSLGALLHLSTFPASSEHFGSPRTWGTQAQGSGGWRCGVSHHPGLWCAAQECWAETCGQHLSWGGTLTLRELRGVKHTGS